MLDFVPMIVILVLFIITMGIVKRRKQQRVATLAYLSLFSGRLVYLGVRWTISMISARYLGYGLGVFALLWLFGVNIWYGGPLDPRRDPENTDVEASNGESSTKRRSPSILRDIVESLE